MPSVPAQEAKPVRLFEPPVARPLRWRQFVRWLRSFSVRTGILLVLVFTAGWGFSHVRLAWVCTREIALEDPPFAVLQYHRPFALSPDGRRVLTVNYGKKAAVFDIESGRLLRELPCAGPHARLAAFSADGRVLATAEWSRPSRTVVHLWDAGDGRRINSIGGPTSAGFIALSPDGGELLAPLADDTLATYDVPTGTVRRQWKTTERGEDLGSAWELRGRYLDDGKRAFVWSEYGFTILDVRDGGRLFVRDRSAGLLVHASMLPDGRILTAHRSYASRSESEPAQTQRNAIRIWDASTGKCLAVVGGQEEQPRSASVSPDGRRVLTLDEGGGGCLRRVEDGRPITTDAWADAQLHVFSVWSPDGRYILSNAEMPGSIHSMAAILDADTGHVLQPLAESWALHGAFSPDGRRLVTAHTGYTLRLWHRRWDESHSRVMGIAAAVAIGLLALLTVCSAVRDTVRSKGRDQIRSLPRTLRLAAWGWGLLAAVALADTAAATFTGELGMRWWMPPAFLVCLLFAIGLLRRNRAWRVLAKWCLWASLASLCLLWSHLPPQTGSAPASIPIRLHGMPLDVPTSLVAAVYLLLLAFVIAQLVVLGSERVRAVFGGMPAAAGDSSEKESCGGRNGLRPDGAA